MKHISLLKINLLAAMLLLISTQSLSQSLTPLVIGTIHPNDSVVIYYDVTIGAGAGSLITNQGTVTGTGISMVTNDPASAAADEPTITLLNMFLLPVSLVEVKAALKGQVIEVAWNVALEADMVRYEVEKSTTGVSFTKIGEVAALNRTTLTPYTFADPNPVAGTNYYRLRLIDVGHTVKYSPVVKVDVNATNSEVKIYPNPVVQHVFTLQLSNMERGNYELIICNSIGQPIYRKTVYHDGGSITRSIALPKTIIKGSYFVQLQKERQVFNQMIFVQ